MEMKFNKIIKDYLEESNPNLIKAKTLRAEADALLRGASMNNTRTATQHSPEIQAVAQQKIKEAEALEKGSEENEEGIVDWRFIPFQGKSPQDVQPKEKPIKQYTEEEKERIKKAFDSLSKKTQKIKREPL